MCIYIYAYIYTYIYTYIYIYIHPKRGILSPTKEPCIFMKIFWQESEKNRPLKENPLLLFGLLHAKTQNLRPRSVQNTLSTAVNQCENDKYPTRKKKQEKHRNRSLTEEEIQMNHDTLNTLSAVLVTGDPKIKSTVKCHFADWQYHRGQECGAIGIFAHFCQECIRENRN